MPEALFWPVFLEVSPRTDISLTKASVVARPALMVVIAGCTSKTIREL